MRAAAFAIGEWLECPKCSFVCDAPFHPLGSSVAEPELVLGGMLPESEAVPQDQWQTEVAAACPRCGHLLRALAVFRGRTFYEFTAIATG